MQLRSFSVPVHPLMFDQKLQYPAVLCLALVSFYKTSCTTSPTVVPVGDFL